MHEFISEQIATQQIMDYAGYTLHSVGISDQALDIKLVNKNTSEVARLSVVTISEDVQIELFFQLISCVNMELAKGTTVCDMQFLNLERKRNIMQGEWKFKTASMFDMESKRYIETTKNVNF